MLLHGNIENLKSILTEIVTRAVQDTAKSIIDRIDAISIQEDESSSRLEYSLGNVLETYIFIYLGNFVSSRKTG